MFALQRVFREKARRGRDGQFREYFEVSCFVEKDILGPNVSHRFSEYMTSVCSFCETVEEIPHFCFFKILIDILTLIYFLG